MHGCGVACVPDRESGPRVPLLEGAYRFGRMDEDVTPDSPASVLVVKQYEGHVRSMFKRWFG